VDGTGSHVESGAVVSGTYIVEEANPNSVGSGFDLTALSCDDPDGGSTVDLVNRRATIDVDAEETITCTFTNTAQGTIIVEKSTFPESTTDFTFTGDAAGDIADGESITVANRMPGTYTSEETPLVGWDLTGISCDDANSTGDTITGIATFNVEAGEVVTCTFTNTQRGSIEVVKRVLPVGENTQAFTMTAGGGFFFDGVGGSQTATDLTPASNLADATTGAVEVLPASTYTVTETMPDGWLQASAPTCNDGSNPLTGINVGPGDAVVCTFINTVPPPPVDVIAVPVNNALALFLLMVMTLGIGWYFRPEAMR
jgi:hypothetical protein